MPYRFQTERPYLASEKLRNAITEPVAEFWAEQRADKPDGIYGPLCYVAVPGGVLKLTASFISKEQLNRFTGEIYTAAVRVKSNAAAIPSV